MSKRQALGPLDVLRGLGLEVEVHSIPRTSADAATWADPRELCRKCGQPFGSRKQRRTAAGEIEHRTCPEGRANERASDSDTF